MRLNEWGNQIRLEQEHVGFDCLVKALGML
ncbi:MAG: hypothetical protein WCG19_05435 [Chlorobiaceae bacterium]